ncbi:MULTISPECIES: pilus assembly protein PilJ [unclassified Acinetobacter]|uniref:pilus assembly protein PilJ n=1 Tax=unclassified Acinetobacter TaxID=196816 RepID=UPI0018AA1EFC|nr:MULTISPECIES: pilus assembly protein PilJ [unclassified Acinetobacter]MBJ9954849.1 pilus assembly protein PilJ [Acinetobacter baumannii]
MAIITHNKNITELRLIKAWVGSLMTMFMVATLSACSTTHPEHSICDLKVLSLQIPRQSQEVVQYAGPSALDNLKNSQEKFNQALAIVHKKYANHNDVDKMLKEGEAINANIDVIIKHQDRLVAIQDFNILIQEITPEIQAEYNLVTDRMARLNYPSNQVVIAKNQVFLAGRFLNSLEKISGGEEHLLDNIDDFLADVETFNAYLKAQLQGNTELGVVRVKDAEVRESLESIQEKTETILQSNMFSFLKKPKPLAVAYQAARGNVTKSDEFFNSLIKLELNTQ